MEFGELVEVWYPQATSIFEITQKQSIKNLERAFHGGGKGG